jgi:hypothetical protein
MAPMFRVVKIPIVVSALGAVTVAQSDGSVNGFLWEVTYIPGDLDTGTHVTINVINSNQVKTILTLSDLGTSNVILYPRVNGCGNTGAAGTDGVQLIPVVGSFQLVVINGGVSMSGAMYLTVLEA